MYGSKRRVFLDNGHILTTRCLKQLAETTITLQGAQSVATNHKMLPTMQSGDNIRYIILHSRPFRTDEITRPTEKSGVDTLVELKLSSTDMAQRKSVAKPRHGSLSNK